MVARGLEADIDVFLFCGDAYRTATPSPTQQQIFAECMKPIAEANIPIIMITGNHDHPASFGKASAIDIFSHLSGDVQVFRKPTSTQIPTRSGPLQLLAMPWPIPSLLLLGKDYKKQSPQILSDILEQKYTDFIRRETATLAPKLPTVLAGHFSGTGSIMGGSERASLILHEPVFSPAQLSPPPIDYVALGHIHHFQNCATDPEATPVVYSSSIERITFNEQDSRKGFVLLDIDGSPKRTTFTFVETPARRFISLYVDATGSQNPTEAILAHVAGKDITNAIVRLRFRITEPQRALIDIARIRAALKSAFAIASIERTAAPIARKQRAEITRDSTLKEALEGYIEQHPHLSDLKKSLIQKALDLEVALDEKRSG